MRRLTILSLTLRQFLGGKSARVVAGLALIPVLFGLLYRLRPGVQDPLAYLGTSVMLQVVIPTLLPLTVLVLATAALGHEIEDRTLHYLTLKPVSRLRIVLEKLLGCCLVATPLVSLGLLLTYLAVMGTQSSEHLRLLVAMLLVGVVATVAYSAIFLLVSLLVARPLIAALIYSFLWESLLGRFVPGLRYFSIRHFVASVFTHVADAAAIATSQATGLAAALGTLLVISAAAVALAARRLRTMNLH